MSVHGPEVNLRQNTYWTEYDAFRYRHIRMFSITRERAMWDKAGAVLANARAEPRNPKQAPNNSYQ